MEKQTLQIEDVVKVRVDGLFIGYDYVTHVTNKFATTTRGFRLRREIKENGLIDFTASPFTQGFQAFYTPKFNKESIKPKNQKLMAKYKRNLISHIKEISDLTLLSDHYNRIIYKDSNQG